MKTSSHLLALALLLLPFHALRAAESANLAITHVSLIDATGTPPQTDMTLLIQAHRIRALSASATLPAPAGAQIVDGRGKFLIPGLWDMHVHLLREGRPEAYFPLLIANGVVGVRDMGGDYSFAQIRQLRDEIASGTRLGPRFFAPGPLLDGPYPTLPRITRVVRNAEDARAAVSELRQQGADFIKVYNRLPRDAYFAIAAQARAQGIAFAGHVPYSVTAGEASDAGQKSMEHLFNLLFACSAREDELMREKARALASTDATERRLLRQDYLQAVLDSYDPQKAKALFAQLARNGTWQTPTLVQRRAYAFPPNAPNQDPLLRLVPQSQRWRFDPRQDSRLQNRDDARQRLERRYYEMDRSLIAPMRAAGVRFLAGTDSPDGFAVPGFSLHEELSQLVEAGLTPMEALQTATRNPAEYFGLSDSGIIAPRMRADLVLLDANPLQDIRNTRRISAVILDGVYLPAERLQHLLDDARSAARQH